MKVPHSEWKQVGEQEWPPGSGHKAASVWRHKTRELLVLRSITTLQSNELWVHLSISKKESIPSWEELVHVRDCFLGKDIEAYQVLPKEIDYVNTCSTCLHLWSPLDGKRRVANLQDIKGEESA